MLVSFLLVAMPLMVGLVVLFFQIDRLSLEMQTRLAQSASVMESSRLVTTQALSLKRTAEQYLILTDAQLLGRYKSQQEALQSSVSTLLSQPIPESMVVNLRAVEQTSEQLRQRLFEIDNDRVDNLDSNAASDYEKPVQINRLETLIEDLPAQASDFVAKTRDDMKDMASRSKQSLLVLLVTLVPMAILLALISSAVINRPLKKIISLIRRLGEGELPQDTYVGGPQNIAVLGDHLRWLSESLSQIEQQKMTFLQNISHELKTPLTAIREGSELMREEVTGPLTAEQIEVLDILNQNTFLLQNQLESLLDFNLALAMDEPLPQVPVNLQMVVEKIIGKLQIILKSRKLRIEHNTPAARVVGNQAQLESLFENLLTNAIKFSPVGGKIDIHTVVDSSGVTVEIRDHGPGFQDDEVDKVFTPFFQGKEMPNTHIKGTGLGLSIAKRYADLHGGSIEIANSAIGAAVRVLLPANNLKLAHD
ncbi:MAG: HAMP domain-containing sensor histidine kinase [Pseudomonadota bacterium]